MNIGETIKKLRKQKDMTQEQLAEYLNISPQAVSRWENNSTLPDITLVPMLANIFDVTTDMLLGVEINVKDLRIETIRKEASDYTWTKQYDKAEKLLRNGLKEYPNSYSLMNELASVISLSVSGYKHDLNEEEKKRIEEERKPIREEIIALSEKILAECTDDYIRHSSIQRLCSIYIAMDETEKAASFAKKMPHKAFAMENLITGTLKGTARFKHIQKQIAYSIFFDVLNSIPFLMSTSLDDGSKAYDTDECIELHHKIIDIINILIEKGSFGDFN
jgi:transcriptional regulator with XRE-family HTH domain